MRTIFTIIILLCVQAAHTQHLPGISTGNFAGVNGVFVNPANVVENGYKWDVNFIGINLGAGNDQASFSLKKIGDLIGSDSLSSIFIGKNGESTNALLNMALHAPSFMLQIDKRQGVALTSRARVLFNAHDLDGELANRFISGDENIDDLPYSIGSAQNMIVNANVWSEVGLSYGRVLLEDDIHFVKAGATVKYLMGVGNTHLQLNKIHGTLNADNLTDGPYLENTQGRLGIGVGGVNVADFDPAELTKFESSGFGVDIGAVYEYRPENYQGKTRHKYKLRAGFSITDIGAIGYKKDMATTGAYDIHVSDAERLYISEFEEVSLEDLKQKLDDMPQYFTPVGENNATTYKVSLPTAVHVMVDYHVLSSLYVGLHGTVSAVSSASKPYNSQYYSSLSLTPRYETSWLGVYLPMQHHALTGLSMGTALRLGPLYVGSGSILSALVQGSKQVDAFFGLRFGMPQR